MLHRDAVGAVVGPDDLPRVNLSLEDPPASVLKILNGALRALGERGAKRLSMSEIGQVAGVSRGTLYRYFATKDDVLAAVTEYVSLAFENGVRDVAAGIDDPRERLGAVLDFHDAFSATQEADSTLLVEPQFVANFFRSHFARHCTALREALDPTFDYFDQGRDRPVDRDGVIEFLVRAQVSRVLVPGDAHWPVRWDAVKGAVTQMLSEARTQI